MEREEAPHYHTMLRRQAWLLSIRKYIQKYSKD